jgi:uncharacterized repeat protein (TIGR03803 family)
MSLRRPFPVRWGLAIFVATLLSAGVSFASTPSEYVIYAFPPTDSAGAESNGPLVADGAGNLYGTTNVGGTFYKGTAFKLSRPVPPSTKWTETVLYSFTGARDGSQPLGGLIFDHAGNLYGSTSEGGASGLGIVFELTPPTSPGEEWTELTLYSFRGGTGDGASPVAGIVFDGAGNLYGTTNEGGITYPVACPRGCGTVFQLVHPATSGAAWTEHVIHYFNSGQGAYPRDTPIFDAMGYLYGTASEGGMNAAGVIFRLAPATLPDGAWTYKVLHAFAGAKTTDSAQPYGGLTLHDGILYGTATAGGAHNWGTVFQVVPPSVAGGAWTENILFSFEGINGGFPTANVIFDKAGNLYSTTYEGGGVGTCYLEGCGTVFRLTPPATEGAGWTETVLHGFPNAGGNDGSRPSGGLILNKNDVLLGVTSGGGSGSQGTVFGIVP